jgi:pimeloyl-ACP methyl ester carboxylesterase
LHAYDELLKIAGNRPIFVAGNSLGTAPALYVAAERPVAGLMLQNPPPMRQIIWREFGWWNLWLLAGPLGFAIPSELDSIANARRVRSPAIFITSMKDEVVPVKYQKLVINVFRGPRNVMELENGDHNWALTPIEERELKMHLAWLWVKGTPVPIPPSTAAATRLSEPQVEHEVEADVQRDVDREAGD